MPSVSIFLSTSFMYYILCNCADMRCLNLYPKPVFALQYAPMSQLPVFTIGYGAREMDAFVAVLQTHQIAYLLDVRSKPYSRFKPDFSKQNLEEHLKKVGIRYVFLGDTLGGQPDDPTCYSNGKVDYEKLEQQLFYRQGIGRLRQAWQQQLRVTIMCSEGKPEQCHRSKLIGKTLTAEGILVMHIDENDQLVSQSDVIVRIKGQTSLFGEDFFQFTSRKRHQKEQNPDD